MENKIIKNILILASFIAEVVTLKAWFVCKSFTDIFHHTSINLTLQLDDYIHADKGTPIFFTRLFHNKPVQIVIDYVRFYLQFWDVRFGSNWFSIIGYFGIFAGFYYILSNKQKKFYHWLILAIILLLPFVEIIFEPSISLTLKSLYLWLPFILFSLYGIFQFINHGNRRNRYFFILFLVMLSFWWLLFVTNNMGRYCIH